jgi:hypothetical protein
MRENHYNNNKRVHSSHWLSLPPYVNVSIKKKGVLCNTLNYRFLEYVFDLEILILRLIKRLKPNQGLYMVWFKGEMNITNIKSFNMLNF